VPDPGPLRPEIERYLHDANLSAPESADVGVESARAFHERSTPLVSGPGEDVARV
jgi:hypothetical protein